MYFLGCIISVKELPNIGWLPKNHLQTCKNEQTKVKQNSIACTMEEGKARKTADPMHYIWTSWPKRLIKYRLLA
jgi:hypothetical protein